MASDDVAKQNSQLRIVNYFVAVPRVERYKNVRIDFVTQEQDRAVSLGNVQSAGVHAVEFIGIRAVK